MLQERIVAFLFCLFLDMIQFIRGSIRELKHVVWPTRKETTTYFLLVVVLLILFGIYLFIFSTLFSEFVFSLKDKFAPTSMVPPTSSSQNVDINNLNIDTAS